MILTFDFEKKKNKGAAVEIGGKKYYIGVDLSEAADIITAEKNHWEWLSECLKSTGGIKISAQSAVMKCSTKKVVDAILGDGSFSEIFSDRKFEMDDGINLILFLSEALKELGADGADNIN